MAFDIAVGTARMEDIPQWIFQPEARVVLDRRVLLAATEWAATSYIEVLGAAGVVDRLRTSTSSISVGTDNLHARYELWQGSIDPDRLHSRSASWMRMMGWFSRYRDAEDRSIAGVLADMRAALEDMVNTDVPEQQLAHARHLQRTKPRELPP